MSQKDHPRVCGEKYDEQLANPASTGSPPRVRGKGGEEQSQLIDSGITPACAGKSSIAPLDQVRQ